jgi:hypothetical protein
MPALIALLLLTNLAAAGPSTLMTCTSHIFPETCAWDYKTNAWACDKTYPIHDGLPYNKVETLKIVRSGNGDVDAIRTIDGEGKTLTSNLLSLPAALCTGSGVTCESTDRAQGMYLIELSSDGSNYIFERRQGTVRTEHGVYQNCQ